MHKKLFAIVETDCGDELASKECKTWGEAKSWLLDAIDGDFYDGKFTRKVRDDALTSLIETGEWEFDGVYCNENDTGRNWSKCKISITGVETKIVSDGKPIPYNAAKVK